MGGPIMFRMYDCVASYKCHFRGAATLRRFWRWVGGLSSVMPWEPTYTGVIVLIEGLVWGEWKGLLDLMCIGAWEGPFSSPNLCP